MIRGKGEISKIDGQLHSERLEEACEKLPDNSEFLFVICDKTRNRNLPILSYLFSVVLKYISDSLPDHPSTTALYRYFEDMFAPIHTSNINNEQFSYCDLKSERQTDVSDVVESIIGYARDNWGIEVPSKDELKDPKLKELYAQAYLNIEADWNSIISSRNRLSKDERRSKEKI